MTRRTLLAAPLFAVKPIRAAMVGTGHGHALSKQKALESMAEYDFVGASAEPSEAYLRDPSIELIAVEFAGATENLAFAQRAIDAGKFVHLDKPPGADLPGLRRLLADAKSRRLVVQMGYQWRYHPAMEAVLAAARQGWLGEVHRFRASIEKPILADERRHLARYKGGMMFSEGCHLIDRATALLGKPTRVHSFLHHHGPINDGLADNNLVVLEYPSALAEISMGGFDPHGNQHRYVEVIGTNGSAKASPFAPARLTVQLKAAAGPYKAGEQSLIPPYPPGLAYTPDFREMAAIIRSGQAPKYSAEHDLMTHAVLLEACGM